MLAAAAVLTSVLLVRGAGRRRALRAWRTDSRGALETAHLAFGLIPASEQDVTDRGHWQQVRDRVEQAAQSLERAATAAPEDDGRRAALRAAEGLRGLMFALESALLLRQSPAPPTAEQLMQSDAAARARRAEAQAALDDLDRIVATAGSGS